MTLKTLNSLAVALCIVAQVAMVAPALAVDDDTSTGSVDLTSVRAKIDAGNFPAAIEELRGLAEDNQEVDVYNLLGFSLRKTGDYATALTYYDRALSLQPDYKPAREYLGELYLDTGDVVKAKEQLAVLVKLCPAGCEERADLETALAAKSLK
jgi:tetratricopeptide (TPR) repeat protein